MKEKLQRLGLDFLALLILALIASPFLWANHRDQALAKRLDFAEQTNLAQAKDLKEMRTALDQHAQAIQVLAQKAGLVATPPAPAKPPQEERKK